VNRPRGRRRNVKVLTLCRDALSSPLLDGAAGGGRRGRRARRDGYPAKLTITARAMAGAGTAKATTAFRIVR
jgi:hypothetical protein